MARLDIFLSLAPAVSLGLSPVAPCPSDVFPRSDSILDPLTGLSWRSGRPVSFASALRCVPAFVLAGFLSIWTSWGLPCGHGPPPCTTFGGPPSGPSLGGGRAARPLGLCYFLLIPRPVAGSGAFPQASPGRLAVVLGLPPSRMALRVRLRLTLCASLLQAGFSSFTPRGSSTLRC